MAGIFISYRRDDAPGVAGRLFDHLRTKFARRNIFMDVDAMKPGIDFVKQLDAHVSQCHVLLAIIGPHWLDAKDPNGQRRLDGDNDYVRIEIASALKRDIPVIPILVDGAVMPSADKLSDDLKPLVRRHALELRHTRFSSDAATIINALEELAAPRHIPWRLVVIGVIAATGIAAGAAFWPKLSATLRPVAPPLPPTAMPASPKPAVATSQNPIPPALPAAKAAAPGPPAAPDAAVRSARRSHPSPIREPARDVWRHDRQSEGRL